MTKQPITNKNIFTILLIIFAIGLVLFFLWYFLEVRFHVDNDINSFKESIIHIQDPQSRIREVVNYTVKDFEQAYNRPLTPSIFSSRFLFGITNDPYFVAYYHAGACAELASLQNFYATKSGFESRIVGTSAEDHQWNEIMIDDHWIQVDPTIYYYAYTDPKNFSNYNDLWFNNSKAYSILKWYGGYSTVSVIGTDEDLTVKYCNTSKLSVSCENCNHIKIRSDNGRTFSVDQELKKSDTIFTLGRKNYTITAERNIIPFLLVRKSNVNVSLLDHDDANVKINPDEIQWTTHSILIFIIGVLAILGIELYYITNWGVRTLKEYLKRQE